MKKLIVSGTLVEFLKKSAVFPYLGIFIVLAFTFRIYKTGDDQALLNGLDRALVCLSDMPERFKCDAGVLHFPIFQYLIGAPLKVMGFSDASIIKIFGLISIVWSSIAGAVFWRAGAIVSGKSGGHLGLLTLLSGYLLWYMTSSFNEAAAFCLFSLLALSVIDRWRIIYVCGIAFACTLTKEVAFPFVGYFLLISFLARELKVGKSFTFIRRVFLFLQEYKLAIFCIIAGVAINAGFNYFRFGSIKNLSNLSPLLFTPWIYVPKFFLYLFLSPAGGLTFTWLSLCALLIFPIIFSRSDRSCILIVILSLAGLIFANLGLARWFSPFGWVAWGPRLTLPFLGAVGVLGIYCVAPKVTKYFQNTPRRYGVMMIFMVAAMSSLPNISMRLDTEAFYAKIFSPTSVEINSGIKNFTIQSAPANQYMEAATESYARNVIIPATIETSLKYWPVILFWLLSLLFISRKIVIGTQDSDVEKNTFLSNNRLSYIYPVHFSIAVSNKVINAGITWTVAIIFSTISLFMGSALYTRNHREPCAKCFDLWQKLELGEAAAEYRTTFPYVMQTLRMDNFPARQPLANIRIQLKKPAILKAIYVTALDYLGNDVGNWTTRPVHHLWGIGIVDESISNGFRNDGPRNENLKLPIDRILTLLIPDNGSFSKCPDLYIQIFYDDGSHISTLASCKLKSN